MYQGSIEQFMDYSSFELLQAFNNNIEMWLFDYNKEFISSNIPIELIDMVSSFFGDAKDIYRLWHRLSLATRKSGSNGLISTHIHEFIKTFKECIYRYKQAKVRKSFFDYVYSAWQKTSQQIVMRNNARSGIYYDWLS